MIETSQILIIAAVIIMTVLLTVISIQLVFVLRDFRRFLQKTNKIIDDVEHIGSGLTNGYAEIVGFITGIKKIADIIEFTTKKKHKDND